MKLKQHLVILFGILVLNGSFVTSALASESRSPAASPSLTSLYGKVISDIEFKGLQRIEKDAVLLKLSVKPGQKLDAEQVRTDIQTLFGLGHFDDIEVQADSVDAQRVKVIYVFRERPAIAKIEFEGNERISTSDLREVMKIKEWSILDANKVREDVAAIQKHYEDKGFYLAKVNFEIKPHKQVNKQDEVELIFKINDYDKVQVKKITFLNNRKYTDEQLKAIFQETKEGGLLSAISGSGSFKESGLKVDLQRLTYWYLDHGYVKFRYENPVVTVSDDKRWLYVSIYMDEGEQYTMGTTDFSGDLLFPKDDLALDTTLKKDDIFSISKRNADIQKLTEKYQDLGYAFTNVIPKMNVRDDVKIVDIDYAFEKGNLVHFGEIRMVGNSKTHDKVIRRELKINEGELYSGTKLRQSRENVERLGFFQPGEVLFNTLTPKGKPDILDVEIGVKERSTGTITLGAGYGSIQKFFFTTTVAEINFLGRGQTISLAANFSAQDENSKSFNLGFTEPYAFDSRWTLGADIYYVNLPIPNQYLTRKLGFDIRTGHPLADYVQGYITYKNEGLRIEPTAGMSFDIERAKQDEGVLSSIVWSVVRDKRNNRFETTAGEYQSLSIETAGLGGDKKFVKTIANNRYYKKLIGDLVFRNSVEAGHVASLSERPVAPAERFYLGGPNSLKGYRFYMVGPNYIDGNGLLRPQGGEFEVFSLFEVEYPLLREAGLKWVMFYDVGNTWNNVPSLPEMTVRADWGFGIRWFSPIGPLRFEWGFPINPGRTEPSPEFQFFIGPPF